MPRSYADSSGSPNKVSRRTLTFAAFETAFHHISLLDQHMFVVRQAGARLHPQIRRNNSAFLIDQKGLEGDAIEDRFF